MQRCPFFKGISQPDRRVHVPAVPPLATASLSSSFLKVARVAWATQTGLPWCVAAQDAKNHAIKCSKADFCSSQMSSESSDMTLMICMAPKRENCLTFKLHSSKLWQVGWSEWPAAGSTAPWCPIFLSPWRSPRCAQPVGMPLAIPSKWPLLHQRELFKEREREDNKQDQKNWKWELEVVPSQHFRVQKCACKGELASAPIFFVLGATETRSYQRQQEKKDDHHDNE